MNNINKIKTLISSAVPLPVENIDTDQIIPARFLKATSKKLWRKSFSGLEVQQKK